MNDDPFRNTESQPDPPFEEMGVYDPADWTTELGDRSGDDEADRFELVDNAMREGAYDGEASPPGWLIFPDAADPWGDITKTPGWDTLGGNAWYAATEPRVLLEDGYSGGGGDGVLDRDRRLSPPGSSDGSQGAIGVCESSYGTAVLAPVREYDAPIPSRSSLFSSLEYANSNDTSGDASVLGSYWNREELGVPDGRQSRRGWRFRFE